MTFFVTLPTCIISKTTRICFVVSITANRTFPFLTTTLRDLEQLLVSAADGRDLAALKSGGTRTSQTLRQVHGFGQGEPC